MVLDLSLLLLCSHREDWSAPGYGAGGGGCHGGGEGAVEECYRIASSAGSKMAKTDAVQASFRVSARIAYL